MRRELKNFTGIDSPYEVPENAEIRIDTMDKTPEQAVEQIINYLTNKGALNQS